MSDIELLAYFLHQVAIEICSVIGDNGIWYSKSAYQITAHKICYYFLCHELVGDCLHLFSKVVNGNQDESMTIRGGRLYQTINIHAPSYEQPRRTHGLSL